jgi:hypothetical protein
MPRGVSLYDEAQLQGRLWTPAVARDRVTLEFDVSQFTVDADGSGNVQTWRNASASSNNATQATSTARPALTNNYANGRTFIVGAASKYLNLTSALAATDCTIYAVFQYTGTASSYRTIVANASSTNCAYFGAQSNNTNLVMGRSSVVDELTIAVPFVGYHVASCRFAYLSGTGNTHVIGINGTLATKTTAAATYGSGINQILADRGSAAWTGGFGHLIVFAGRHTDDEMRRFEGYLAWRWGLVANLPAAHPFKSRPPLIGG